MRKLVAGWLGIVGLLAGAATGCAHDKQVEMKNPPRVITVFADSSQSQDWAWLSVGQMLQVRLRTQAGTGYAWRLTSVAKSEAPLRLLEQRTEKSVGERTLAGDTEWSVFDFRANRSAETTLEFVYERPWETNVAPVKKYTLNVEVNP